MRKLTGIMISMMLIFSFIVLGQSSPLPINGRLTGDYVSNLPVEVKNMRTLVSKVTYTSGSGEYLVGATELQGNGYYLFGGDVFRVTVLSCLDNPACVQEITYIGQDELFLLFDLTAVELPDQYVCWNGDLVTDPELCPAAPQEYVCWDDSVVTDIANCPDEPEDEVESESSVTSSTDKTTATATAFYGQDIEVQLDDNKIRYLIDGEIDFNNEKYEVREEIYFAGITQTSMDDDDYGINPYLVIDEYAAEYKFLFNEQIPIADISEEDPADIIFLGKNLKIIKASANEITVRYGSKITLLQGESGSVDGIDVEIMGIFPDEVSLKINGISGSVSEGDTSEINGIEVVIDNLLYQGYADGVKQVTLIIGEKVQATYKDGDYFDLFIEDNEEWEWIIQLGGADQYLGVWNTEAYIGIDEDDEYHALGVGESLFLPNDYVEIKFQSITTPDLTDLNIRAKDGYLYLRGPTDDDTFSFGTKDYDRVYMNDIGIYDEDFVLITTDKVEIGDSGIYLEKGSAKIGDLTIEIDLSDILFKGISFALKDETFMDYFGIIFSDPENAVEEKRGFEVLIPEEQPEVTIAFGSDIPVIEVGVPEGCPKEKICTACKTCIEQEECEPTIEYVGKDCPPEKVCSEGTVPEGNTGAIIIAAISALLIGGASGIYFTRNKVLGVSGGLKIYKGRDGEEVTLHKHPGIRSYHDPATSHREDHERHPKGQLFPHYVKEESGRYVYEK